ncbi:MAG: hypothetical protein IPG17_18055 [Sandaracinaceae bacterium]|nr:hypothetical protein [Sandaracinaceae bacterium]
MSARTVPTREALRSALDVCIGLGAPLTANEQGAFRGDAFFGEALAGPPGRLHGGLHAYARVLSILRALRGPSALTQAFPLELDMRLERALPLETALTFEGTYTESAGGFALHTRFSDTPKLDAHARSAAPLGRDAAAPFRAVFEQCQSEPARTLSIRGSFPVTAHRSACYLDLTHEFFAIPGNELSSALRPDGTLDAAFTCIALDWLGAIGMGVVWQAKLYTTRMALHLDVDVLPRDTPLRVMVDCTRPAIDPEEALSPVMLRGELATATSLPVALLSQDLSRAYATGRVTLLPVAGQTERLGAPPP